MNSIRYLVIICLIILPAFGLSQPRLKPNSKRVVVGETLNYKAKWGFLTIGTASTKVDKNLYKLGSNICYKIQLKGETNGLARMFYLNDRWVSYISASSITTLKSFRSIHEGNYRLEEIVFFDQKNKKAEVKILDRQTNTFVLKNIYKTPENIRDVVAGFMVIRLIDLSKYAKGDKITIKGFYKDTGYKIDVIFLGKEYIKTNDGKIMCYRVKPIVPRNHVFDDVNAVDVWLSANKAQSIIFARAKLFIGNLLIELDS